MNDNPHADASPRGTEIAALAMLGFGVFLRFQGLGRRQLWLDEIVQLRRFSSGGVIGNLLDLRLEIAAAPLDYLVQHVVVSLAGRSEFAARFHAAVFGCVALWVFYAFCRRLLGARPALIGLLLLAVSPLHVWYSREGRGYSLFFLLATAAWFALWNACRSGGLARWTLYGLLLTLSLFTNYLGLATLAAQALFVGVALMKPSLSPPNGRRLLAGFAVATGTAVLAFSPWLLHTSQAARGDVAEAFAASELGLRLFKEISGGGYPLSFLLCLLFGLGARRLWKEGRRIEFWLLAIWLAAPIALTLLVVWWRGYLFAVRQVLVSVAPLLMGAAWGVAGLARRRPFALWGTVVLTAGLSLGAVWLHQGKEEADWKSLSQFLSELDQGVPIVAPHVEFALSYYLEDLPRRSLPLEPDVIASRLCRSPGTSVALAESRYMDASQIEAARQLKQATKIRQTRSFRGFQVYVLGCATESSP